MSKAPLDRRAATTKSERYMLVVLEKAKPAHCIFGAVTVTVTLRIEGLRWKRTEGLAR